MVVDLLNQLLDELERLGLPGRASLNPGLTGEKYMVIMNQTGLNPPGEHFQIYSMFNGVNESISTAGMFLFPDFSFLSLAGAVTSHLGLTDGLYDAPASYWQSHWFPIFWDFAGSYYLIAMDPAKADHGSIYFLMPAFQTKKMFSSIGHMLKAILQCFREQVFVLDENYLICDYREQQRIFEQHGGF